MVRNSILRLFNKKLILNSLETLELEKKMAKSRFEYVKTFEHEDKLLKNCWIVVRIDGKAFHKFTAKHNFDKPNDENALNLMNRAAVRVMQDYKDIGIAYGQSDEYSFVFRKDTDIYNRRGSKIMSYINSLFTSAYVYYWSDYFNTNKPLYPPTFDARIVLYPTDENLKDYLSWRQADVHVNNLYNTTFWKLVLEAKLTNAEAEKRLCGTFSSDKNEILFTEFGINYNNEPVMFRKGTTLLRKRVSHPDVKTRQLIVPLHEDMIKEKFWSEHSEILIGKSSTEYVLSQDVQLPDLLKRQLKYPVREKENNIVSEGNNEDVRQELR